MAKPPENSDKSGQGDSDKSRLRKSFPNFDLAQTLVVATAIAEENAGKPWSRLSLADAIHRKPDSSAFRDLLSASIQYGLTEGSSKAPQVKLTELGIQVVMPKSDAERKRALLRAARNISLFNELYTKYDQAKLPAEPNFKNTLIRDHGLDPAATDRCIAHFVSDGKYVGLIRTVAGSDRVDVHTAEEAASKGAEVSEDYNVPGADASDMPSEDEAPETANEGRPAAPPQQAAKAIFIAHGHDRTAVESLQNLLKEMGVEYKVAKDEAHAGRPISQKVADLMQQCTAGIFVASADDKGLDANGQEVMRARQNVVYELGAASLLYGQRIVIFKEKGVEFPTDFSDLGYIEYERGHLADKFTELIRELVKLKAVRISAGG